MSPLIPHVAQTRLTELQTRLESLSKFSVDFAVLLTASTVIATLGLFLNSPAVIIGAMIIAPLMRPLVGLSLAALTADTLLFGRALTALVIGTICGASIAAALGSALQSMTLTPEILSRTHPNLLDLGVALFAGAVGAYCQTNESIAESLAGVAIAVALVPPLSVVGIGLAHNSESVWAGAALLYATNLVGITFAGAVVFLVMGYTPLKQARKGLAISAASVMLLAVPLGLSMRELMLENELSDRIRTILREKTYTFRGVHLQSVEVKRFRKPTRVVATVIGSDDPISPHQVKLVQDFLTEKMGLPIEFRLRIIPSTEVTALEVSSESSEPQTLPLPEPTHSIAPDLRQPTEASSGRSASSDQLPPDSPPNPEADVKVLLQPLPHPAPP